MYLSVGGEMTADNPGRTVLQEVLDEAGMVRTVARMGAEILERGGDSVMLVGIHTRGVPLARWAISNAPSAVRAKPSLPAFFNTICDNSSGE